MTLVFFYELSCDTAILKACHFLSQVNFQFNKDSCKYMLPLSQYDIWMSTVSKSQRKTLCSRACSTVVNNKQLQESEPIDGPTRVTIEPTVTDSSSRRSTRKCTLLLYDS